MLISDTVLTSLISTLGTVITTALVVYSGRKTREHIKEVKRDVKEIREALHIDTAPAEFPARKDRDVTRSALSDGV